MSTFQDRYEFELFIEGVKIDFKDIGISVSPHGISANIEIPANNELRKIIPNTKINLFFKGVGDKFRSIFEGQVIGYSIAKSHNFMSYVLHCRDLSGFLDQMYKYTIDNINYAEIQRKIISHLGAPSDPNTILDRTGSDAKRRSIVQGKRSISNIVDSYIEQVVGVNDFFKNLESYSKFRDRFYHYDDPQESEILHQKKFEEILRREGIQNLATFREILLGLCKYIFYEMTYIASPSYVDDHVRHMIIKPDNFFVPPPLCNMIFPNMITGFNYSRQFMQEPTRLALRSMDFLGTREQIPDPFQYIAYAPVELRQGAEDKKTNVLHYYILDAEKHKGIIPVVSEIPNSVQLQAIKQFFSGREPGREATELILSAQYLLQQKQCMPRRLNVTQAAFNPGLVINFPSVLMSDPYMIFGVIDSINHTISSSGNVSTAFSMSYCHLAPLNLTREDADEVIRLKSISSINWNNQVINDTQKQILELLGETTWSYPPWLNENYKPSKIDNVYQAILGCNSIMSILGDGNSTGLTENVREAYEQYTDIYETKKIGSIFTNSLTSRPIVTKEQLFGEYLGISGAINDMYPTSGYFDSERQNIIIRYKQIIDSGVGKL